MYLFIKSNESQTSSIVYHYVWTSVSSSTGIIMGNSDIFVFFLELIGALRTKVSMFSCRCNTKHP